MDHVASFERYSTMNQLTTLETGDPDTTTYPWYWKPKHGMELQTLQCSEKAYSVCDHKSPLLPLVYGVSVPSLMRQNKMSKIGGFYVHPMNSISVCVAYCVSKNQISTIIISGTTCICIKGIVSLLISIKPIGFL